MNGCIFPGSFDPITCGHLNMIKRISSFFDHVIVVVMVNVNKKELIPKEERVKIIKKACCEIKNVEVDMWTGMLSEYVLTHPESIVIRGVRNHSEFEQEKTAALLNKKLNPGMETFLIPADSSMECISSSAVKEIAAFSGDFKWMIPENVYDDVYKWLINKQ